MKAAMPDVAGLREVGRQQQAIFAAATDRISSRYQELFTWIAKQPTILNRGANDAKLIEAARPKVPALQLDFSSLFPNYAAIQQNVAEKFAPAVQLIQHLQRDQFANAIGRARAAVIAMLPPNWRGEDVRIPQNLEGLLLDEGLALAWVPPTTVVVKLFNADSPGGGHDRTPAGHRRLAARCSETVGAGRSGCAASLSYFGTNRHRKEHIARQLDTPRH